MQNFALVATLVKMVELACELVPLLLRTCRKTGEMTQAESDRLMTRMENAFHVFRHMDDN